ncbi:MAG: hypothetical protein JWN90_145 [Parcubacteria group bacterium]|nr:hypothetical protein [Parcubacteria group bacterium]
MTEQDTFKLLIFPAGVQRSFIETVEKILPVKIMASLCGCSERTVRDWRREKNRMPLTSANILSNETGVAIPKHDTCDRYAHTSSAGKKGYASVVKKYGSLPKDEARRSEGWKIWWETVGKFEDNPIYTPKEITIPPVTTELAEFIGIMIGDGGISSHQVRISLHHIDDREYCAYVVSLIMRLFGIDPAIQHRPTQSVKDIVVSRIELVRYLNSLGLPQGNKVRQQIDIPAWIREDVELSRACVRGLIDTDGCVFTHSYVVKGKRYSYKKIDFTSASEPLRRSVHELLLAEGMRPRFFRNTGVRLESKADVSAYFNIISSSNPKHLKRYVS